jgi:hypothetical protein
MNRGEESRNGIRASVDLRQEGVREEAESLVEAAGGCSGRRDDASERVLTESLSRRDRRPIGTRDGRSRHNMSLDRNGIFISVDELVNGFIKDFSWFYSNARQI